MPRRKPALVFTVVAPAALFVLAAVAVAPGWWAPVHARQTDSSTRNRASLTGRVTSAQEGPMVGVLVRARRTGSSKTITVVTDAQGRYSFPSDRLEPGRYDLSIRAVGYVLQGQAAALPVDVPPSSPAHQDLTLDRSNVLELAFQLTDPEWLASYPLDDETKFTVFRDCSRCHTLQRPSMSRYTEDQLAWVMKRMVYSAGSSPMTFQLPTGQSAHWGRST
jgi:virginiamycin B lyase